MDLQRLAPFGLRMPPDLKAWVMEEAQRQDRSVNNLIVQLLKGAKEAEAKK
ncbi:MAG: toxin-antitoxin system HicB family antitoxin [Cypionkella sp.]